MLIEFRVANHRSLREEQVLTLEEAESRGEDSRPRKLGDQLSVLPVAALYGANGSGKSNVLGALAFVRNAVIHSHRLWEPDAGIPRDPFAWGPKRIEPSLYELTFWLDGVRTQYGFVADDERFVEEWLYVWPHGRKQTWFERDGDVFKFGENLKGENQVTENVTRPNGLFLSAGAQNRHEQLGRVFRWFRSLRTFNVSARIGLPSGLFGGLLPEESLARRLRMAERQRSLFPDSEPEPHDFPDRFRELLRAADIGIVDFRLEQDGGDGGQKRAGARVSLQHKSREGNTWLPFEKESGGTRQLFKLGPLILDALRDGGVLLVDELETSFHPLLALHLVRTFNDPTTNPKNAQLIFTTHDTNLLGNTAGDRPLRRDQVWFAEKNDEGASVLYPLSDYMPRKAENLERGYLQGRYGGIPFLGELAPLGESDENNGLEE